MKYLDIQSTVFVVAGFLLFPQCVLALSAVDYDSNNNGLIEPNEIKKFLKDKLSTPVARFDVDNDGSLSADEIEKANEHLNTSIADIELTVGEFQVDFPAGQNIAEFAKKYNTDDKDVLNVVEKKKSKRWQVRSTLKEVSVYENQLPRKSAKPATISFTRDVKSDNESLGIKGVVGYPVRLKSKPNTIILPSLDINQLSNSQKDKTDIDTLVFRLGVGNELDGFIAETSYFGYGIQYATDTDFDKDVRGLDFSYEPVLLGLGQGANRLIGTLLIRWRSIILGEAGKVHDVGKNSSLVLDESYVRLGGEIDVRAVLKKTPKFQFGLGYAYLEAIDGDLRDRKLFSASMSFDLDDDGNFKLETRYTNGDRSIALEDEESWTIGLGIRL